MKMLELNLRITKNIKIIEFHVKNLKKNFKILEIQENQRLSCEHYENHENLRMTTENYDNHETHITQYENHGNHGRL